MQESPFRKGFPWLAAGLLLLLVSTALYLYDLERSEADILSEVQRSLNDDFQACIDRYATGVVLPSAEEPDCQACALTYVRMSSGDRLVSWTNNEYLPTEARNINRLRNLENRTLLRSDDGRRVYYQLRQQKGDTTLVILLPIHLSYEVNNEFLPPYIFLGRWQELLYGHRDQLYARNLVVNTESADPLADVVVYDTQDRWVYDLRNVPVLPFRSGIRYTVLVFMLLGGIALTVFLRIYSLYRWHYRYLINLSLFLGVLGLRLILYWVDLPGNYVDAALFSPEVLAFHVLAPSLGEMTLNIFTAAALIWIAYMHVFRINLLVYQRVMRNQYLAWPVMFLTLALSSYLLKVFVDIFYAINVNSQIDIDFTNLFKADIFAFLILLDVGIMLLSIALLICLLVKLNVLFGRRYGYPPVFWVFQVLSILVANLYFHEADWVLALVLSIGVGVLGYTVYRVPFRPILHQDLPNYLLLVVVVSILVTYCVISGVDFGNQLKAERVVTRILGNQVANTAFAFNKALNSIERDQATILEEKRQSRSLNQFRDWLRDTYVAPNFKEFDVELFFYDTLTNRRLDKTRDREPSFGPDADIPLEDRGERIFEDLYQLPNTENKYLDLYVGRFYVKLDRQGSVLVMMELSPNDRETEGLYPYLSMDQEVYEDLQLVNQFDHAIYRDGILYSHRGNTSFPIYLADFDQYQSRRVNVEGDYVEYFEPIPHDKLVVVRYPRQTSVDVFTTFSFIFYFYVLTGLLIIVLPVLGLRLIRLKRINTQLPLRAKIRIGLFVISVLPMLIIILLLSPFIRDRYNREAEMELQEEAARITDLIGQDYLNLRNDPFSRITLERDFQERIRSLESAVRNDINVYDENGRRLASTQPLIFELGISSDLMDAEAYQLLKTGNYSELVVREEAGNLEYLSGYRPIIGNTPEPIGYVNIPYLAKQDKLDEQVINFLAYLANIYLVVFLLINLIAVLISSAVTKPLAMIQQRLASFSLGNRNEPIIYETKDEIGSIISAYNDMVAKLSESEQKLSQSQREMAWRQMARQVAHEIKNPLTPMKLSIQHLNRASQSQSDQFQTMFPKVMKTLLVQIESLVRIANSFHEFAKMPEPVKTRVRVNEVLLEVVDLYGQSEEALWLIDVPDADFWTYTDRDQLSRCFNNIIKNGLQALDENGIIQVTMKIEGEYVRIEISDNGQGMDEEVQKRVFEPSFSTKTSGMGLGLAIVRRIIEHSGGKISFESTVGEGTTFLIELPSIEQQEEMKGIEAPIP